MIHKTSKLQLVPFLLLGMVGCVLMGGSDWLMIYGDTAFEGNLAWLTVGAAQIPAWRNALALVLAFPAVLCYALALFRLRLLIPTPKKQNAYCAFTALGLTPWLCLHLFYVMILFTFSWLTGSGQSDLALVLGEAMFSQFSWLIMVGEVIMILPFLYWFYLIAAGYTVCAKPWAINNPLVLFVLLKLLTSLLPDTPFRLAFTNGLMSESMILWFLLLLPALPRKAD